MPDSRNAARALVDSLGLAPHPEGGYYRETHRDPARVARLGMRGALPLDETRAASTAIYYLLDGGAYSAWHRIDADEIWHFYAGDPLALHVLDGAGKLRTRRLGNALEHEGVTFQLVVPAGCWFAAECTTQGFSLVGCTVAPGFEFAAFELADVRTLAELHPSHEELLTRLAPRGAA
ncbi:cupin domain-containing protein [Trinickia caryophylli]|uniref:DUF985 domain-containing protein n=1 Tax=Trinickia caryophylli TaxID=28094 RepID=A0A1X7FY75_TRICW|nr:cupin domain-containing protein [Trinickia caryophylli]PMS11664.1 hypothetical protein C0Z17_12520 [Trinickia caryophylli]TRX17339.1 cupin domain-containing protein [Trinickia caryophylli]WQE11922.1 cupin domain-containing protein [Trinickia caryophylli]SMF60950.1 hypothetical protein SAMN06295900_112187 [Trinickia caryophylli]GLU34569.1 hypothetical protein Busp01_44110 [Trinickia caryophylli]